MSSQNLVKSWEKGIDRIAHIERMLGMAYLILFALSYHVFDSKIEIFTFKANWIYIVLYFLITFSSIHLANLIISLAISIMIIEEEDDDLCLFSSTIKYRHQSFKFTVIPALFSASIISTAISSFLLKEDPYIFGTVFIFFMFFIYKSTKGTIKTIKEYF